MRGVVDQRRSSTSISERAPARSKIIDQHGGIVLEFIGDAIMAIYGAPIRLGFLGHRSIVALAALVRAAMHLFVSAPHPGVGVRAPAMHGPAGAGGWGWQPSRHVARPLAQVEQRGVSSRVAPACAGRPSLITYRCLEACCPWALAVPGRARSRTACRLRPPSVTRDWLVCFSGLPLRLGRRRVLFQGHTERPLTCVHPAYAEAVAFLLALFS